MEKLSVLIVEDERLMRQVLRALLADEHDLDVVGDTGSSAEAVFIARQHQPRVVLMDINLSRVDPAGNGIETTREILKWSPRSSVVMLTSHDRSDFQVAARRAGACGYLLKTCPAEEMAQAVRAAARGEFWLHPGLTEEARPLLTGRELQVLNLMVRGITNREIASRLFVSEKTVKEHSTSIFKKLNVRGRSQAVLYAVQNGLAG